MTVIGFNEGNRHLVRVVSRDWRRIGGLMLKSVSALSPFVFVPFGNFGWESLVWMRCLIGF